MPSTSSMIRQICNHTHIRQEQPLYQACRRSLGPPCTDEMPSFEPIMVLKCGLVIHNPLTSSTQHTRRTYSSLHFVTRHITCAWFCAATSCCVALSCTLQKAMQQGGLFTPLVCSMQNTCHCAFAKWCWQLIASRTKQAVFTTQLSCYPAVSQSSSMGKSTVEGGGGDGELGEFRVSPSCACHQPLGL